MISRDVWSSKTAFVLASIGSAIGLGNLWRFPYVAYQYGGGAFLVAYAICFLLAGIPLLMLEFAIGKRMNNAAPGAFRRVHPGVEWFGWFSVGVGFMICTYYSAIMALCLSYLVYSFTLAWGDDPATFFSEHVLAQTDDPAHPWQPGPFRWQLLAALLVAWFWVMFCIRKGAQTVSKVVWVTVLGPWALLILFVVRGITLEGAGDGLNYYLAPQWSMLWNFSPDPGEIGASELWLAAISQVFFSLTVGFGVMIAYGSFMDEKTCIVKSSWLIGIGDALTAFIGGFAVFGALGHKARIDGVTMGDVVESGPGLAFVTYPEIINDLPLPILFGILFFLMLSLLAVDTSFSLVEAMAASLRDKFGFTHRRANLILAGIGLLLGLPYIFGAGIHWLDIADHFLNFFGLSIVVLGTCLIVGWYYPADRLREFVNSRSKLKLSVFWDIRVRYVVPAAILFMLGFEVYYRYHEAYGEFAVRSQEFIFGWAILITIFVASLILASLKGTRAYEASAPEDPPHN